MSGTMWETMRERERRKESMLKGFKDPPRLFIKVGINVCMCFCGNYLRLRGDLPGCIKEECPVLPGPGTVPLLPAGQPGQVLVHRAGHWLRN